MMPAAGYTHRDYAASLAEFGAPRHLPGCGGWALVRVVEGSAALDGRGPYPLFACNDWTALESDFAALGDDLISLALVADPFGNYDEALLRRAFPEVMFAYKQHFVVDLRQAGKSRWPENHVRNVQRSLRSVEVNRCEEPLAFADEWTDLYAQLTQRHRIQGMAAFSAQALRRQLKVPGLEMFRAARGGETVGIVLWYAHGEIGYYHLAAYSQAGYEVSASFALFACSIEYFTPRLRWLCLGAGAGVHAGKPDGLTRFKSGWATGTRPAYFCGKIFNRKKYDEIAAARGVAGSDYFPIYRKGE